MAVTASNSLTYVRDAGGNKAVVRYQVFATTSGSSHNDYTITTTVTVDGQTATNQHTLPYNTTTTCYNGEFTVSNASGRTITGTYSIPTGISAGTLTGSATVTIPTLITTPTLTASVTSRGLTSLAASMTITNNGGASIVDRKIEIFTDSACTNKIGTITGASGTFTGLSPNTTYYIKANASNGTFRGYSSAISGTTYNYATITSAQNINHGGTLQVNYSNPSGSSLQIAIYKTDGTTAMAQYRNCTGTSYTFSFTDNELDNIYKQYGTGNVQNLRVYLKTAGTYINYTGVTITLTGNQKTIHEKVSTVWRRGKGWKNIAGTWKRWVVWEKISGTWRRAI